MGVDAGDGVNIGVDTGVGDSLGVGVGVGSIGLQSKHSTVRVRRRLNPSNVCISAV